MTPARERIVFVNSCTFLRLFGDSSRVTIATSTEEFMILLLTWEYFEAMNNSDGSEFLRKIKVNLIEKNMENLI